VDAVDAFPALRLAAAILVLGVASVLDWRTRRVGNPYWMILSFVGLILLTLQVLIEEEDPAYLAVLVPILAILSDVYWDREGEGRLAVLVPVAKYATAVTAVAVLVYLWADDEYFLALAMVPIMMLAFVVMYMLDVIRGGADAKALIALAVLFPFYPDIASLPLLQTDAGLADVVFPFSFVVLINAAIIVVFVPLVFAFRNAASGDFRFPQAFLGYRMEVDRIAGTFVWLMERVEEGRRIVYTRPRRGENLEEEVGLLKAAGASKVWVTPKIPFLIPITLSVALSAVAGNLLLLIFPL